MLTVKGGLRGGVVFALTNLTKTSAGTANSIVTSSLGIAEQAFRLRSGEIDEVDFIENAELVALHAAVSAVSSTIGQALIPIPVVGAIIGNTAGTVIYGAVSKSLSAREAALIEQYLAEQAELDERLSDEHQALLAYVNECMSVYLEVLDRMYSPNIEVALAGSIDLAKQLGVPSEEILDSQEKVSAYFLD